MPTQFVSEVDKKQAPDVPAAADATPAVGEVQVDFDYVPARSERALAIASRPTISRLTKSGRVRSVKVGAEVYVNIHDLEGYVAEKRTGVRVSSVYEDVAKRVASFAPAFSDAQKQRLVELLSE